MSCDNKQQNMEMCNCTYSGCPRMGKCCECLHYHRRMGQLPACYFNESQERTYDRSIRYFVKCNS